MSEFRTISVDGVELTVVVQRKRVKHLNARLHGTTVSVSVPYHATREEIERAIPELARTLLRRARAKRVNREEDAVAVARRVAARFPRPPEVQGVVFVTTQSSRWGSFSPKTGTIRLNAVLRQMPPWVLEAVVAHELAHAIHLRHSESFRALVRRVCPDTDRADAFLDGVSWLAGSWQRLPPVERALLVPAPSDENTD
ncbi:MAG: YgjP-like metallopeptidase domain-containing protein [Thermoanaerobaculaceae bacterium]